MPTIPHLPRPFALCAVLLLAATVRADELEKLLARPLSPGGLAILTSSAGKPGVAERFQAGLKSPDARTRGAAARAIDVEMVRDLLPAVQEALTAEGDPGAATEEMRAAAAIGGSPLDADILAAASRFSPRLDSSVTLILAHARGTAALPIYFSTLRAFALTDYTRVLFFKIATRGQPEGLIAAAALAFGRHDSAAWQAVLTAASELDSPIDSPLLETALRSDQLVFRGEAAWYLAKTYCDKPSANSTQLLQALSEGEPAAATEAAPELVFGAEMLRRVLGNAPVEDPAWIACLETNTKCHLDSDIGESSLLRFLTPREREAIVRRNEANRPPELKADKKKDDKDKKPAEAEKETLVRLVSGLPAGVAESLFEVEGWNSGPTRHWYAVGVIEFRKDGAPRQISIRTAPMTASGQRTTEALFLMSRAPDALPDPSARPAPYLALFVPNALTCEETWAWSDLSSTPAAPPPDVGVLRVRGDVQAPKLGKRVEPLYPEESRRKHEQGVSLYEAMITTSGCVTDLRLVKSSYPTLDIMGMEAIAQWRYQPARLNGKPVRVWLTVTVTFRLK